ncbi:Panacea domain-containing protein [Arthrobacter sp. zg-Y1110]|uniref:Panacea domain-containing protein n=1 Tax=Arthrobacter sp. zg-Y1110 TaxID=2886932 RepID=UPI001D1521E4|nr:type II toxin-antitoxin system antitoxin SocA domain-containing protein [Arthrobacter sp. zg-Y1110]MCC3292892.1 DUF4065 domain-containing protein [Arthrobacter sp. zg-Y1110]UWX86831.1 DUF4065 domain-containing protein [Arthrobacter sp. zg-Y1110]
MASSKLHKLTYFCQAYHLAWYDEPLFSEDVLAAASGPVILEFFKHSDLSFPDAWPEGSASNLDGRQSSVINSVFKTNSFVTGMDLGDMAREHVPWIRARAKRARESDRPAIDPADMASYYRALSDAPQTRQDYAARFMDRYLDGGIPGMPASDTRI